MHNWHIASGPAIRVRFRVRAESRVGVRVEESDLNLQNGVFQSIIFYHFLSSSQSWAMVGKMEGGLWLWSGKWSFDQAARMRLQYICRRGHGYASHTRLLG